MPIFALPYMSVSGLQLYICVFLHFNVSILRQMIILHVRIKTEAVLVLIITFFKEYVFVCLCHVHHSTKLNVLPWQQKAVSYLSKNYF